MIYFKPKIQLIIFLAVLILLILSILSLSHKLKIPSSNNSPFPSTNPTLKPRNRQTCIQVITPAIDPKTGKCQEFPTPCDVPNNWQKTPHCAR